ncbi:hypothetical protein BDK51DRAFT_47563 [Blyttiomyces helicus]|uniref:Uncharacterized protein n=1 Tax=Blyttiomyces helicus TaxID=388810 RepID=A0A4P9W132_9FUNG|nr:hypothetical protein BDK51DRAFT_47563 [Blyttiomyces helicus]|eukprot:RKO85814.1 hypothetical protein BDK51DRAFT_47563 [Blyttiomyces helicus]
MADTNTPDPVSELVPLENPTFAMPAPRPRTAPQPFAVPALPAASARPANPPAPAPQPPQRPLPPLNYEPPEWSGVPAVDFHFEVLKNGTIVEVTPRVDRAFLVVGM